MIRTGPTMAWVGNPPLLVSSNHLDSLEANYPVWQSTRYLLLVAQHGYSARWLLGLQPNH